MARRFTELKTPDGEPNTTGFYTSVGTILIAINPYQYHPIYTAEHVKKYRSPGNQRLPPHVFQVAAAAHTALSLEHKSQAILISGESGAGKTEATKHCLSFFAEVSGSDSQLEVQVLLCDSRARGLWQRQDGAQQQLVALRPVDRGSL